MSRPRTIKILVIALLKPSQVKHKIVPLSRSRYVGELVIVRKYPGPEIEKVRYLLLPKICRLKVFNLLLTPFLLVHYALREKADLLLAYHFVPHGFFAWFVSIVTKIPFLYSQIDLDVHALAEIPFLGRIVTAIIRRGVFINVPGSRSKEFWLRRGIESTKINILHSTVDPFHEFRPTATAKMYDLIYVGVLERRKQIDRMLQALAGVCHLGFQASLLIVGEGNQKRKLENLSLRLGLSGRVSFLGHREDIQNMMNQAEFFILTSKNEGIPCAMLEAMACGLIPISRDVADVSDIVVNGSTGILLKDDRIETIRDGIVGMMRDRKNRAHLSANSRRIIIEQHSHETATRSWDKLLGEFHP